MTNWWARWQNIRFSAGSIFMQALIAESPAARLFCSRLLLTGDQSSNTGSDDKRKQFDLSRKRIRIPSCHLLKLTDHSVVVLAGPLHRPPLGARPPIYFLPASLEPYTPSTTLCPSKIPPSEQIFALRFSFLEAS